MAMQPGPIRSVARDLCVSMEALRRHVKRAEVDAGDAPGLTTDERTVLVRLRRESRTLRVEREIAREGQLPRDHDCRVLGVTPSGYWA